MPSLINPGGGLVPHSGGLVVPPTKIVPAFSPGIFPRTPAALNAIMGAGSFSYALLCNEFSGDLTEQISKAIFNATGTPTYRNATPWSGEYAVGIDDNSNDKFQAPDGNFMEPNSLSFAWLLVYKWIQDPGATWTGFAKYAAAGGYRMRNAASGTLNVQVGDGLVTDSRTASADHDDGNYHTILFGLDLIAGESYIETDLATHRAATAITVDITNGVALTIGAPASTPAFHLAAAYAFLGAGAEGITDTHRAAFHSYLGLP